MSVDHNPTKPREWNNGKFVFELFPPEMIALNAELNTMHHPKLAAILAGYPDDEIDIKLAQIASYCEVMLDGVYDIQSRATLCKILTQKLIEKREPLNGGGSIVQSI
jgi:hypothetical protein